MKFLTKYLTGERIKSTTICKKKINSNHIKISVSPLSLHFFGFEQFLFTPTFAHFLIRLFPNFYVKMEVCGRNGMDPEMDNGRNLKILI